MASLKKILLIEDAQEYVLMVKTCIGSDFEMTSISTAKEAQQLLRTEVFHLVIIDIMLPDSNGFNICRDIRSYSETKNIPIIFISSRTDSQDKLMAFTLGANDYVTKPFNLKELKARIDANIHRPHVQDESINKNELLKIDPFELDLRSQRLFLTEKNNNKSEIQLTKTEYLIFLFLFKNPDRVFSRSQILESVWGSQLSVTERTVDTHISKLRSKIQPHGHCIEPVHGFGYRFNASRAINAAA